MFRQLLALLVFLFALPDASASQGPVDRDAPGVLGYIIDGESRGPIVGVAVTLRPLPDTANIRPGLARSQSVLTDEYGRFVFDTRSLVDGPYEIAVERLGYASIVDSLVFRSRLRLRIEAALVPAALELDPLLVVAEARSQALESRGFYLRRVQRLGRFLTPDEVRSLYAFQVSDLFRLTPGVTVSAGGRVSGERIITLRGGCVPTVYVDAVRAIPPLPLDCFSGGRSGWGLAVGRKRRSS